MSSAENAGEGKHSSTPEWPDEATTTGAGERIGGMDDDKTQVVTKEELDRAVSSARSVWRTRTLDSDSGSFESSAVPSGGAPFSWTDSNLAAEQHDSPSSTAVPASPREIGARDAECENAQSAHAAIDQVRGAVPVADSREWVRAPAPHSEQPFPPRGQSTSGDADRHAPRPQGPAAAQGHPGVPAAAGHYERAHEWLGRQHSHQGWPQQPDPVQYRQPGPAAQGQQYYQGHGNDQQVAAAGLAPQAGGLAANLRQEAFTTELKPKPESGWRKALLKTTFGLVNLGPSRLERVDRERKEQVGANIPRTEFVYAVLSPRGGVAKTTTTAALGSIFADVRGAEVIVIDANPNKGNLASRVNPDATATFADILRDRRQIRGVNDIRTYAKRNAVHLDVLAGDQNNRNPQVYDPQSLVNTVDVLRSGYRVIGIDVGQNLQDPVVAQILDIVTAVVVVSGLQYGSGKAAVGMYDWLVEHGRADLVQRSTLLISDRHPEPNKAFRGSLEENVAATVWRDPVYVPYDEHLYEDTVIDVRQLAKPTYRAYLEAAARLSSFYGQPALPLRRPAA
ncbi:hypothetical protein BTO20_37690 (plasmid) [Mycobacterium dioxanotrophicus]|uniref:CobQ/CobB/MinD/ParA nucleotide binding domain-containing protein n=1 Tax=Mycobacterium dioxanotrophicus TaxID=482462 RepID=A0A1Y0CHD7_9MYCO|nr:hypothetical protein [Mycobacterium dioxanotrophicus]ART74355.1 hypothetical protein BTO20_37690 [Mycobacterium dioxanotrophicus]